MKEKFRNYGLWISLISAVLMILQSMGLKFDLPYINEVITSILGVLVALGIISNPSDGTGYSDNGSFVENIGESKEKSDCSNDDK